MNLGVANVQRGQRGTLYRLTFDDGRKAATVDYINGVYGVRDRHDMPVRVGSSLYDQVISAIAHYEAWSASHS